MENLKGIPLPELENRMVALGHSPYRGRQLFRWIHQKREWDFEKMTDFQKPFRSSLAQQFHLPSLKVRTKEASADGTTKFLVELEDGNLVESVFIPQPTRNTLCVSTQVGCKMACTFCATGYQAFTRDLKSWEMVDQLLALEFPKPITNIVFMGMGEPFDNYEELTKALEILSHPLGPQIGKRHITVSTVGITSKIQDFVSRNLAKLAISLHGTTEEQRASIMPVSKKFPLKELIETCENLDLPGRTRITFEYVLIKDVNDSEGDAKRLAELLKKIPSKINLLSYNENPFVNFKRPPEEKVLAFQNILLAHHYTVTYRKSRGREIAGACGQLRTQEERAMKRGNSKT